jgi:serine protease
MATPHVAAAAALMLARNSALTPAQVKTILTATATTFPSFSASSWANYDCATLGNCGAGILNANQALLSSLTPFSSSAGTLDFGTVTTSEAVTKSVTLSNITGSALALGTTRLTGANAASYTITGNTCSGTIAAAATCQISVSFLPKVVNGNAAGIYIPAQNTALGAIVVGLTGVATAPVSAATALSATKSSSGSSGGCSVMPAGSSPDFSLLLALCAVLLYRLSKRSAFGKN